MLRKNVSATEEKRLLSNTSLVSDSQRSPDHSGFGEFKYSKGLLRKEINCRIGVHDSQSVGCGFESHPWPFFHEHGRCSSMVEQRYSLAKNFVDLFSIQLDCPFGVHGNLGSNPKRPGRSHDLARIWATFLLNGHLG